MLQLNALVLQKMFLKLQLAPGSDPPTSLLPLNRRLSEDHGATEILSSIHSTTQTTFMNLVDYRRGSKKTHDFSSTQLRGEEKEKDRRDQNQKGIFCAAKISSVWPCCSSMFGSIDRGMPRTCEIYHHSHKSV